MTYTEGMRRGFTLVEILLVISIIAILSSIIIGSITPSRQVARDSQRTVGLNQIKAALETYYIENRAYPSTATQWQYYAQNGANYIPNLVPSYIDQLPRDPLEGSLSSIVGGLCSTVGRYYYYKSDGANYKAYTCTEKTVASSSPFYDPSGAFVLGGPSGSIMICSGEPACSSW